MFETGTEVAACPACGKDRAKNANVCPHCGNKRMREADKFIWQLIGFAFVLFIIVELIY